MSYKTYHQCLCPPPSPTIIIHFMNSSHISYGESDRIELPSCGAALIDLKKAFSRWMMAPDGWQ